MFYSDNENFSRQEARRPNNSRLPKVTVQQRNLNYHIPNWGLTINHDNAATQQGRGSDFMHAIGRGVRWADLVSR